MRRLAKLILAFSVMLVSVPSVAGPSLHTTQVDYRVFPGLAMMDGNWAALFAASDGKVYAGLAYHGGDGHLVYYDPKTDHMHDVGNLTALCGESLLKRGLQSKIHAKFGEGKDGRIYFGTHAGYWWDMRGSARKKDIQVHIGWPTIRRPTELKISDWPAPTKESTPVLTIRSGTGSMG
jgi:hypothetical protein